MHQVSNSHWTFMTAPWLWEIYDAAAKLQYNVCLFTKPNFTSDTTLHLLFDTSHRNNSLCQWCWMSPLPAIFTGLCDTHTPTLRQARGKIMVITSWVTSTRSAFRPVSVDMPFSMKRMQNCSSRSCSTTVAKIFWLNSLNWNVLECTQCIKPSYHACFWLELIAEQGFELRLQQEEQR